MTAKNNKKRSIARELYVTQGYTAKKIAELIGVAEATVGRWVNACGWKQQREAAAMAPGERSANIDQIISLVAQDRLTLSDQIKAEEGKKSPDLEVLKELREQVSKLDASAAYWNKCRETAKKDEKIPLEVYLKVMEQIFNAMRIYSLELYLKTTPFQDQHIYEISTK